MALLTDGRFSGGTHGGCGHIAPEAQDSGPIAYLRTGDMVTVDQDTKREFPWRSDEELAKRKAETTIPPLYSHGVLGNMLTWYPLPLKVQLRTSGNRKKLVNKHI